jgi:hypothetical protein
MHSVLDFLPEIPYPLHPQKESTRNIHKVQMPKGECMEKPKLLDQVRARIRVKHYSKRTEDAYTDWIKRFVLFHHMRHPEEMAENEISQFLSHLAVDLNVSASTQNLALNALPL